MGKSPQVAQHFDELIPLRSLRFGGDRSKLEQDKRRFELIGQLDGVFRAGDSRLDLLRDIIAAAGRKAHGRDTESVVVQQLANLPDRGLGHLRRPQFATGIEFDPLRSQAMRRSQCLPKWLPQAGDLNPNLECWHELEFRP